ncbi:MAG: hypothetical protein Q9191_005218 [Dirinaria sp. TL-2023a]
MSALWKPLTITIVDKEPHPLLARYEFGPASYTIYVTDLTFIWAESLGRKQIIKRALNLNTSIDPSEDATQMQLLLRHVREALEGREGTSMIVSANDEPEELNLNVCVALPSPLSPLEWPLHMEKASPSVFTEQFVLPALGKCSLAQAQVASLLQHLKEKDHVISKLTEKILSDGSDLSRLFPGASTVRIGSKLNAREALGKSVKGLSDFDENHWRHHSSSAPAANRNVGTLLSSVFESDLASSQNPDLSFNEGGSSWRNLTHNQATSSQALPKRSLKDAQAVDSDQAQLAEADDFERQSTPPQLKKNVLPSEPQTKKSLAEKKGVDRIGDPSTTEESDEDNLVETSGKSKSSYKPAEPVDASSSRIERLANISARSRSSSSPQSSDYATGLSSRQKPTLKRGESEDNSPNGFQRQGLSGLAKPKHRLGKIGGRNKIVNAKSETAKVQNRESTPNTGSDTGSTVGKLESAEISGARNSKQGDVASPLYTKPQPGHQPRSPRQITEEQADRNRKRLQEELESRGKIGNKKKRKF